MRQIILIKRKFTKMNFSTIRIVEVGPRDGLQNESKVITPDVKVELIKRLNSSGLKSIEIGSFVSPKWVPQMANTEEVVMSLKQHFHYSNNDNNMSRNNSIFDNFSVLTPNVKGVERAVELGVKEIAIFGSATESFSQKNINCSISESLLRFKDVCVIAKNNNIRVRGYVSCVLGCPYEGIPVDINKVSFVTEKLLEMGCYEVSLGDTVILILSLILI